jgi:hypothetical protein
MTGDAQIEGRKHFFSEEKNQKTLALSAGSSLQAMAGRLALART